MSTEPKTTFDSRFSDPSSSATGWSAVEDVLATAELYWISTVRSDGRPHVTPLIGIWHDGAMHFTTGLREQKAHNLERNPNVALTTGNNTWDKGLDVVVEGAARRISDNATLQEVADAIEGKYGSVWHFEVGDGAFGDGEHEAALFRVDASKVLAFAKEPHGQTAFRF